MFYVSPYNDEEVIAGQGSCGVEIAAQLPDVDHVFVAIGGATDQTTTTNRNKYMVNCRMLTIYLLRLVVVV
jgi:threonine dehydratase